MYYHQLIKIIVNVLSEIASAVAARPSRNDRRGMVGWARDVIGISDLWVQYGLGGGELFRQRDPTGL
jgi:phosphoenolpyruvate carboxylase